MTVDKLLKKLASLALAVSVVLTIPAYSIYGADERTDSSGISYPACTHLAYKADSGSPYGNGNYLYSTLKVTGSAIGEEEIFNVSELERIYASPELNVKSTNNKMQGKTQASGIDMLRFLELCGLDPNSSGRTVLSFYQKNCTYAIYTSELGTLKKNGAAIIFASGGKPLVSSTNSIGYSEKAGNQGGPLILVTDDGQKVTDLNKIIVNFPGENGDPHYGFHTRDPLRYMESTVFSVNYIDKDRYPETEDSAEPFRTFTFTMKEIEEMMAANPEKTSGNYYGVSGNEAVKKTLGLGGFMDYYEGINLSWLLREKTGLKNGSGKAVLYGRDNDRFAEISNLGYFFANRNYSNYYSEADMDSLITGVEPILAVSKNGYPLLPRHDHKMEGNIDFNTFNKNAELLGFNSKIGIVKNVSGPFVAGLSNLDGVYGGYQKETNGDCIRLDLYVSRAEYENQKSAAEFSDVSTEDWFYGYVNSLTEKGIINGVSEHAFKPYAAVTRAQFVKMIAACSNDNVNGYTESFSDVDNESWAAPYIGWAENKGIVSGSGGGKFEPDAPVTREQMTAITDRYIKASGISLLKTRRPVTFRDESDISGYAVASVSSLSQYGIISGRDNGLFDPKSRSSRAEAAAVISLLSENSI